LHPENITEIAAANCCQDLLANEPVVIPMAIHEQRREDLLKEATAYRRRVLLSCELPATPASAKDASPPVSEQIRQEVFFGIRDSGSWSLYVDQDPVLQFTSQNTLRRLFWKGERYAARNSQLRLLARETAGGKVQFRDECLVHADEQWLIGQCLCVLQAIAEQLRSGRCRVIGQFPDGESRLLGEMLRLLCLVEHGFLVADSLRS
jgi:hypothetical protein